MAFIPAFSEPQSRWSRNPRPPALGQSEGEARAAGFASRGTPPSRRAGSASSVTNTTISSYSLIESLSLQLPEFSATRFSKQQKPHRTAAAVSSKDQSSNTQHSNRTNTTPASSSPTKDHNYLLPYVLLYSCSTYMVAGVFGGWTG